MPELVNSTVEHSPCLTFTLFNKPPPELRLRIWWLSISSDRLVPLQYTYQGPRIPPPIQEYLSDWMQRFGSSPQPTPQVLQVNVESRTEALRLYKLTVNSNRDRKDDRSTYFNPDVDTATYLWLGCVSFFHALDGTPNLRVSPDIIQSLLVHCDPGRLGILLIHLFSDLSKQNSAGYIHPFTSLQRLHIRLLYPMPVSEEEFQTCKKELDSYFEGRRVNSPEFRVPQMFIAQIKY